MAAVSSEQLPEGWEVHTDEETGETYYWNTENSSASWSHPGQQDSSLPFGWEQLEGKQLLGHCFVITLATYRIKIASDLASHGRQSLCLPSVCSHAHLELCR